MLHTKTVLSRTITVLYLVSIGFICFANIGDSLDGSTLIAGIPMDKIAHFAMFLPFALLAYLSFDHPKKTTWTSVRFVVLAMLAGFLIAGATEVIQGRLPYRAMEITDFYADCSAIALGSIYVLAVALSRQRKSHHHSEHKHKK